MNQACPISLKRIDTNFVRIIAIQVISVALLLILTQELLFALILLFDFSVRVFNFKNLSPFAHVAKIVIKSLHLTPQLSDEAPKRFALYVGIFIISLAILFYLLQFTMIASIIIAVLIICASLEAVFDYCLGCKIYYFLQYFHFKR